MRWFGSRAPPAPMMRPVAATSPSGRPTYAAGLGIVSQLPRPISYEILAQFWRTIPAFGRAVEILSGFAALPDFVVEGNEAATRDLSDWTRYVRYGDVGFGLGSWLRDHVEQSLQFGFAVGEMVADPERSEIVQLWAYKTPAFSFRSRPDGELDVIQSGRGGLVPLNPVSVVITSHRPEGCDPHGKSLLFASGTFCQIWQIIAFAYRETWKRNGTPIFHVHTTLAENLNDPDGSIATSYNNAIMDAWNAGVKSQYIDGRAQDFFTANVGNTTITSIGADASVMDVQMAKRAIVEEIVAATGVPAWLMGYVWSSSERLSTQQADVLLAQIGCIRAEVSPALLRIVTTRQMLRGVRGRVELRWPDITLQDLVQTAEAAYNDARAEELRMRVGRQLWADGVFDQTRYAQHVLPTESEITIARPVAEPGPPIASVTSSSDTATGRGPGGQNARGIGDADGTSGMQDGWQDDSPLPRLRLSPLR